MQHKTKRQFHNRLALFRRRKSLEQKQVANLLGHNNTVSLSRFENGIKVPNLKTALKLATIYNIPVRVMLDGYYESCLEEIRSEERKKSASKRTETSSVRAEEIKIEFCTIEEKLLSETSSEVDFDKASRHASDLIHMRAEKLGHI
jgi:transcriptional regulator with XRE-family HTH domain